MLDLVVVCVVFLDWDLDTLLDVVHVTVELGDILDVADGLWDLKGLLLVDYLFDLFDLGAGVGGSGTGLGDIGALCVVGLMGKGEIVMGVGVLGWWVLGVVVVW